MWGKRYIGIQFQKQYQIRNRQHMDGLASVEVLGFNLSSASH